MLMEKNFLTIVIIVLLGGAFSCTHDDVPVNAQESIISKKDTLDDMHWGFCNFFLDSPQNIDDINKERYIEKVVIKIEDVHSDVLYQTYGKIKGRGNSTWKAPKRPYILKLNEKASLLNLPEEKSWVLLANYYDPIHLRNGVASYISSKFSSLEYTPHYTYVNLFFNGEYRGIYQFGEKLKIGKNRVNIGDDGFLLEIDGKPADDDPLIYLKHLRAPINIKDPDVETNDDRYVYLKDYLTKAEDALFSDYFMDENLGWKCYFDIESLVDWYLINEIAKNVDGALWTSCYMNLRKGEKIKMGPIWDFDVAFGNYIFADEETNSVVNLPEGFVVRLEEWFQRLFLDPVFVNKVKTRFTYFYNNREQIYDYIDKRADVVSEQIIYDNNLWKRVHPSTNDDLEVIKTYNQKVFILKKWLEDRFQWLHSVLI